MRIVASRCMSDEHRQTAVLALRRDGRRAARVPGLRASSQPLPADVDLFARPRPAAPADRRPRRPRAALPRAVARAAPGSLPDRPRGASRRASLARRALVNRAYRTLRTRCARTLLARAARRVARRATTSGCRRRSRRWCSRCRRSSRSCARRGRATAAAPRRARCARAARGARASGCGLRSTSSRTRFAACDAADGAASALAELKRRSRRSPTCARCWRRRAALEELETAWHASSASISARRTASSPFSTTTARACIADPTTGRAARCRRRWRSCPTARCVVGDAARALAPSAVRHHPLGQALHGARPRARERRRPPALPLRRGRRRACVRFRDRRPRATRRPRSRRYVLRELKRRAEAALGETVTQGGDHRARRTSTTASARRRRTPAGSPGSRCCGS